MRSARRESRSSRPMGGDIRRCHEASRLSAPPAGRRGPLRIAGPEALLANQLITLHVISRILWSSCTGGVMETLSFQLPGSCTIAA